MFSPIFVVGSPRSGTTLLSRLLGAHPEVAMTTESCWVPLLRRMRLLATTPALRRASDGHGFEVMGIIATEDAADVAATFDTMVPRFVRDLFDRRGRTGASILGDKLVGTPDVEFACRMFPDARYVVLTRDPRDILVSSFAFQEKQATPWSHIALETRIQWLQHFMAEVDELLDERPRRRVRYEDLVRRPLVTVQPVLEWLGLEPSPEIAVWIEHEAPGLFRRHGTSASTAASIGRWRRELTPEQREVVNARLDPCLAQWGYA